MRSQGQSNSRGSVRSFWQGSRTAKALNRAVVDYFDNRVRVRVLPDFVYESLNGENIVAGTSIGRHLIHKDLVLARVLDINGLAIVFKWARLTGKMAFRDFPLVRDDIEVNRWLDNRLYGVGPRKTEQVVSDLLDCRKRVLGHRSVPANMGDHLGCFGAAHRRWARTMGLSTRRL